LLPDIEGVWTFITFNYNRNIKKAVGFLKYFGQDVKRFEIEATHPIPD